MKSEDLQFPIVSNTLKKMNEKKYLENKLKNLEHVLDNDDNLESYHNIKDKIEEIYEKNTEGVSITSKCLCYEKVEEPSKLFLNLVKCRRIQGQIRKGIVNDQEITDQKKIQNKLLFFYETLFRNTSANSSEDCKSLLNKIFVPKLNYEDVKICEVNAKQQISRK